MTMAFTVCALFTYILWWHKPFDSERSAVVLLPIPCHEILAKEPEWPKRPGEYPDVTTPTQWPSFQQYHRVPDFDFYRFSNITVDLGHSPDGPARSSGIIAALAFFTFGAIFSAIHFAAWNWVFPRPVFQTLWQSFCSAALGSTLLPLVLASSWSIMIIKKYPIPSRSDYLYFAILMGAFFINLIARLALIVLTFYCFTSMPASVYQDLDWTQFLPHFS